MAQPASSPGATCVEPWSNLLLAKEHPASSHGVTCIFVHRDQVTPETYAMGMQGGRRTYCCASRIRNMVAARVFEVITWCTVPWIVTVIGKRILYGM